MSQGRILSIIFRPTVATLAQPPLAAVSKQLQRPFPEYARTHNIERFVLLFFRRAHRVHNRMAYRNGTLRRLVHAVYRLCSHARHDVAASYAHTPVKYRGGGGGVGTVMGGRDIRRRRRRHRYKTAAAVAQGSAVVVAAAAASAQGCLKCAAVAREIKNPFTYARVLHRVVTAPPPRTYVSLEIFLYGRNIGDEDAVCVVEPKAGGRRVYDSARLVCDP